MVTHAAVANAAATERSRVVIPRRRSASALGWFTRRHYRFLRLLFGACPWPLLDTIPKGRGRVCSRSSVNSSPAADDRHGTNFSGDVFAVLGDRKEDQVILDPEKLRDLETERAVTPQHMYWKPADDQETAQLREAIGRMRR